MPPTQTTTTIDYGSVFWDKPEVEDHLLTFAGPATYLKGTLLARDTATQKWVPFVVGGATNGNGTPRGILAHDATAAGAGDQSARVVVACNAVNRKRLIIAADGSDTNLTKLHEDVLRSYSIVCVNAQQLAP